MPRVIVFDVNETLLDLRGLDPRFESVFGQASVRQEWFSQVLRSAMVATITDAYADFSTIGDAALKMIAARRNASLSAGERTDILGGMRELAPHADAPSSLARLRDASLRLAALTNSNEATAEAQLKFAGLHDYFEQVLSADSVRRLKPAAEVYHMAARRLGVEISGVRLVAAHDWDVTGALRAGCAAAFVARPGMVLDPLAAAPDIVGPDLTAVAERILAVER